jgi:hypothetical protein
MHQYPPRRAIPALHLMLALLLLALLLLAPAAGAQQSAPSARACGALVTIETHERSTTRYALAGPSAAPAGTLVLMVGGGGHLDLDEGACPRALKGNSLVRSLPLFHAAGFATALVDAPSDHTGEDGLAGFRIAEAHAQDVGRVITDARTRANAKGGKGPVWLVGTSRGSISAANAASRLAGAAAPDGLVLSSPVTAGARARKAWVLQSVFDLPLEAVRMPVLVVGHAEDACVRTPPALMERITERTQGIREQVVMVTGGAGKAGAPGIDACEGRSPHGFIGQEAEVAAGIARFVGSGRY